MLDDQIQVTRALAQIAPTPASLLAYGQAELARLAVGASDEPEEWPF